MAVVAGVEVHALVRAECASHRGKGFVEQVGHVCLLGWLSFGRAREER